MPFIRELTEEWTDEERADYAFAQHQGSVLLGAQLKKHSEQVSRHFDAEIGTDRTDILMLFCCLISGFLDSTTYNAYGTFVSMQTGNTVLVGLGSSTGPSIFEDAAWRRSVISIASFLFGSFFFSRFHRFFTPLRRGTLVSSFLLQSILVLSTAILIQADIIGGSTSHIDTYWGPELSIALLSFQSAAQLVGSRVLSLGEIPSVVITSVLCDLASDPQLVAGWSCNTKRNRRTLAFLGILIGAVAGGWADERIGTTQGSLLVAAAMKIMVTVAWMLWPEKVKS